MWAFLKLIPFREYLYAALGVAILTGFVTYTVYERHIGKVQGEAVVVKQDTKVAQAAEVKVTAVQNTALLTETQSALIFKQVVSIPPVGDIGIVCRRAAAPTGGPLPAANAGATAAVGGTATVSAVGPTYDPSGAAETRARAADAQIVYLQRRVKELETEMNGAP